MSGDAVSILAPYAHVIVRPNFGYDFWSYKLDLVALSDVAAFERIVFFNSSFLTLNPQLLELVTQPVLRGLTVPHQHLMYI